MESTAKQDVLTIKYTSGDLDQYTLYHSGRDVVDVMLPKHLAFLYRESRPFILHSHMPAAGGPRRYTLAYRANGDFDASEFMWQLGQNAGGDAVAFSSICDLAHDHIQGYAGVGDVSYQVG